MPPMTAATRTKPTTTPTAIPVLLVLLPDEIGLPVSVGELEAVTMMVCPALVITEGATLVVTVAADGVGGGGVEEEDDDADEPEEPSELSTLLSVPVKATDQNPSPPQSAVPYPLQGELQLEFDATVSVGGRRSPQ